MLVDSISKLKLQSNRKLLRAFKSVCMELYEVWCLGFFFLLLCTETEKVMVKWSDWKRSEEKLKRFWINSVESEMTGSRVLAELWVVWDWDENEVTKGYWWWRQSWPVDIWKIEVTNYDTGRFRENRFNKMKNMEAIVRTSIRRNVNNTD